jgi:hypothetical protein
MRKELMSGAEAGEFLSLGLGLAVVAFVVGLVIAVPWIGGVVVGGLLVWMARGWVENERKRKRRAGP